MRYLINTLENMANMANNNFNYNHFQAFKGKINLIITKYMCNLRYIIM